MIPAKRAGSSPGTGPSKRRAASELGADEPASPQKLRKVHPFFTRQSEETSSQFQWLKPSIGPNRSCLHGINLSPPCLPKVAALDLDGTIIKYDQKNRGKGTGSQWEWWRNVVPSKLQSLHEGGYSVVLISNQALKEHRLTEWKKKIPLIANALPKVPFRIFAACAKDGYRKPMPGMWYELERVFKEHGVEIDKTASFFVGDAAGRPDDFASTDRKWALNVDLSFYTPEEYFLGLPAAPYKLPGFHVSSLPEKPATPPDATLLPKVLRQELVVFTGYPCLGKSSSYHKYFSPAGYVHINQDILSSRPMCVQVAEEALKAGKSVVIDNTNRDIVTRKHYLDLAKKHGVPARCFVFTGSIDLAWHNNLYRTYVHPAAEGTQRKVLPYLAFIGFRNNYQEPQRSEGFSEVIKIDWVFEGDEEARRRWSMWLQIDGK